MSITVSYIVIPPDGDNRIITVTDADQPSDDGSFRRGFAALRKAVGGHVEFIHFDDGSIAANEDSYSMGLPLNVEATTLVHGSLTGGMPILGTVVLTGEVVNPGTDNEYIASAPEQTLESAREMGWATMAV